MTAEPVTVPGDAPPHAAITVCWLRTLAIFRQPSILRNLIWPLATRLKRRTTSAPLEFRVRLLF